MNKIVNKFILSFVSLLFLGCASKSVDENIGGYKDYGIKINVPENWKPISAHEAGQENNDPESDLLRLGYFDPETNEKKGIFLLSKMDISESEQSDKVLANMEGFTKLIWKNKTCYYMQTVSEESTTCKCYAFTQTNTAISIWIGYSESYGNPVTNILNEITFQPPLTPNMGKRKKG